MSSGCSETAVQKAHYTPSAACSPCGGIIPVMQICATAFFLEEKNEIS
jgi:hypothetical protein